MDFITWAGYGHNEQVTVGSLYDNVTAYIADRRPIEQEALVRVNRFAVHWNATLALKMFRETFSALRSGGGVGVPAAHRAARAATDASVVSFQVQLDRAAQTALKNKVWAIVSGLAPAADAAWTREGNAVGTLYTDLVGYHAWLMNHLYPASEFGLHRMTTAEVRSLSLSVDANVRQLVGNWGHNFNANNSLTRRVNDTLRVSEALRGQLPSPFPGEYEQWNQQPRNNWDLLTQYAQGWIPEIGHFQNRFVLIQQLVGWGAGGLAGDIVKRQVSRAEAQAVQNGNGVFTQAPGSFEREKWFFHGGGAPGVGHDHLLTITLKTGAIMALTNGPYACSRDDPGWEDHVVYTKVNEHSCFGIHEDALGAFNQRVRGVRCTGNGAVHHPLVYNINGVNNAPAYPAAFNFDVND